MFGGPRRCHILPCKLSKQHTVRKYAQQEAAQGRFSYLWQAENQAGRGGLTLEFSTGPPELPELMAASVCTASRLMQPCE